MNTGKELLFCRSHCNIDLQFLMVLFSNHFSITKNTTLSHSFLFKTDGQVSHSLPQVFVCILHVYIDKSIYTYTYPYMVTLQGQGHHFIIYANDIFGMPAMF